jgi:rhodanese-related sulfurtransferase
MIGRFVNLPFKVLGTVARAVQERDKAQWEQKEGQRDGSDGPKEARISLDVPSDFDPGPIRLQAKKALASPRFLVDVGTAEQWAASRPADATHIPSEEIDIRLAELPPDVRIVILSRTSQESERVVRFLRHRGLDDTWSLHGGLEAWKKAGGAIEKG